MRRIARAALRPWPAAPVLSAIERAAPRYARLALRARGAGLPRNVRAFPARVAPYFGTRVRPEEHAPSGRGTAGLRPHPRVRATVPARARGPAGNGGGSVPSSFAARPISRRRSPSGGECCSSPRHFGLPSLIGLTLRERGLPVVGVGGLRAERVDVVIGRDVWAAARGMQQVRDALADEQVCVLLVDTPKGRYAEPPFLLGRIPVAAGAFRLAQITRSPLLPVFAVHASAGPRFRVEIGPPLSVADRSSASPFAAESGRVPSVLRGDCPPSSGTALRLRAGIRL